MKARAVPYSSIVGAGIILYNEETGLPIGQVALLNVEDRLRNRHDLEAIAKAIVAAINSAKGGAMF